VQPRRKLGTKKRPVLFPSFLYNIHGTLNRRGDHLLNVVGWLRYKPQDRMPSCSGGGKAVRAYDGHVEEIELGNNEPGRNEGLRL
jgi:hypothetical protein